MQIKCKTCGTNLIFVNSIGCSRCPKCSAENHKTALAPDTVQVPVELVKRIIDRSERTMDFLTDEANTEYLQHCCGHFGLWADLYQATKELRTLIAANGGKEGG